MIDPNPRQAEKTENANREFPHAPAENGLNQTDFFASSRLLTDCNAFNGFLFSVISETRSNSAFANLSPEDHAKILNWLSCHKLVDVKTLLAKPRPEGLGLHTSAMSLSRYKRKFLNDYIALLHDCGIQPASSLAFKSKPRSDAELTSETLSSLRHRLFKASINPSIDPSKLHALACTFEKVTRGEAPKPPQQEIDTADMLLTMLAHL